MKLISFKSGDLRVSSEDVYFQEDVKFDGILIDISYHKLYN